MPCRTDENWFHDPRCVTQQNTKQNHETFPQLLNARISILLL